MIADSLFARLHPHVKLPGVRRKQLLRYNLDLPVRASIGGAVALIRTREQFCQIVDKCKFPGGYEAQNPVHAAFMARSEPVLGEQQVLPKLDSLACSIYVPCCPSTSARYCVCGCCT
jgi:hypothetical protein